MVGRLLGVTSPRSMPGNVLSPTSQESEIESGEYQNDSDVDRQPRPEPVPEEQDIDRNDDGCEQQHVQYGSRLTSHFSPRSSVNSPFGARVYVAVTRMKPLGRRGAFESPKKTC